MTKKNTIFPFIVLSSFKILVIPFAFLYKLTLKQNTLNTLNVKHYKIKLNLIRVNFLHFQYHMGIFAFFSSHDFFFGRF